MGIAVKLRFKPGDAAPFDTGTDDLFPMLLGAPEAELSQLGAKLGIPSKAFNLAASGPFRERWLDIRKVEATFSQLASALAERPELLDDFRPHFLGPGELDFLPKLVAEIAGVLAQAREGGATRVAFVGMD